jgi:DNA processing protein
LESLISGLAGQDICIVSGLAMGVDGEAHRLALKHKMHTIAVPGSGIAEKAIYPKINKDLSDEILLNGGMLLSEFEPEFTATDWSFPARNRIMASISDAVLIIEASERSGTLITARLALDYNKDLMAVPASIFSNNAKGSNDLIKQGAIVINSAEDILHNLGIKIDTTTPTTTFKGGDENSKNLDLSELEKKILNLLKENMSKDKLIQNLSEVEVGEVLMSITMLELKGFIKEEIGFVRRVR